MSVAVVTGASSGIGRVVAIELAQGGHHVVAAGRSRQRTEIVVDQIVTNGGSAEFLRLDLASLESARAAAITFEKTGRTVDVLVNNAGVGATRGVTEDGFEIHFGTNHLGHFMFTHHLRGTFRPGTRIVQVSSEVHRRAKGIEFDRVRTKSKTFFGLGEYAVSKLANVLFAREAARRQPDWNLYAVHPGLTDTNIIPAIARPFIGRRLLTPTQAADTVVWCATSEHLSEDSGLYYARRQSLAPSPQALDDGLAKELWARSEQWSGVAP
jgi:NAD(P)-dependent dehydrogenase (short-subunit alcohol dehydrogenase family)